MKKPKRDETYYIAKTFDYTARFYDRTLNKKLGHEFYSLAAKLAGVKEGDKVLDAGCGTGTLALKLKKLVGNKGFVTGIDASCGMLKQAKIKADKENIHLDLRVASIEKIPFPDNFFDVITSTWVFHQLSLSLKKKGIKEILRVLRVGGHFLLVDLHEITNPFRAFYNLPFYWWNEGYKIHVHGKLPELLTEIGFAEINIMNRIRDKIDFISAVKLKKLEGN
jgi:ubiquinone/menaquinone biosynthesis C-methylase UbiE